MAIKCVSLETAKALKEAGFPHLKANLWHCSDLGEETHSQSCNCTRADNTFKCVHYAMPGTDELLGELPEGIQITKLKEYHNVVKGVGKAYVSRNKSLPEALAAMWIYLKKEGLLNAN